MAFIVRRSENSFSEPAAGVRRRGVIDPGLLPDDRLRVKVLEMEPGASWTITTEPRSLVWLQVLSGAVVIDGERRDRGWVVMAARGCDLPLVAEERTSVLVCHAPNAADYDPALAIGAGVRVFWDNTNRRITTTAAGNFQVGIATQAALAADATVRVWLNRVPAAGA